MTERTVEWYLQKKPIWPRHKSPEVGIIIADEKGCRSFPVMYLRKQKHISQEVFNRLMDEMMVYVPAELAEELFGNIEEHEDGQKQ